MQDPVVAEDGFNYERRAIEGWLKTHDVSPQTKDAMGGQLVANERLRSAISEFSRLAQEGPSESEVVITWDPHGERRDGPERMLSLAPHPRRRVSTGSSIGQQNMALALSKAFQELDPLRELLRSVLDGWRPPKIYVIGDESAGKSTILEQLAMIPIFPRKRRFCTRMAVELRLRRAPESRATLSVRSLNVEGEWQSEEEHSQIIPQENAWMWVQEKMDELVQAFPNDSSTGIVAGQVIVLEVQRPDVPSIDLVDLPGITTVPPEKARDIKQIFESQIEDDSRSGGHGMFLAVVPASGDVRPNTNVAMQWIQEYGLEKRCFGIFSKCDQVADAEVLRAFILGDNTSDGETPDELGAAPLRSWDTTMLKPPSDTAFQRHHFERLITQQVQEVAFFRNTPGLEELIERDSAGIPALVRRLEEAYYRYLDTTWKNDAMKKVIEKEEDLTFELSMLGVVRDEQKDELAKREVERRLGASSTAIDDLYDAFSSDVLHGQVRIGLQDSMAYLNHGEAWEGYSISTELEWLQEKLESILAYAVVDVRGFWEKELDLLLKAESHIETDAETSEVNLVTSTPLIRLLSFETFMPNEKIRRELQQKPLIQLSQYTQFTDAVSANGRQLFQEAADALAEETKKLVSRLVDDDSPWLRLDPLMMDNTSGLTSRKVRPRCDVDGFISVVIRKFLQRLPPPSQLQTLHHGVAVGAEKEDAMNKYNELKAKLEKVQAAKDGICRALNIDAAEFDRLNKDSEAPAAAPTAAPATAQAAAPAPAPAAAPAMASAAPDVDGSNNISWDDDDDSWDDDDDYNYHGED